MKPSLKLWLAVVGVALGALNFTFTAQAQNQIVGNLTVQTKILDANGTAAAPSYTFTNSPTTGFFRSAADAIGVSTAGVERWTFNASGSLNPLVNNTYDIGNGSVNPRDVNAARSFIGPLLANAGALTIQSTTAANVTIGYNSTAVLQIDSTSNATVLGTKTIKFGATAAATIGVSADSANANLQVFPGGTGKIAVNTAGGDRVITNGATYGNITFNSSGMFLGDLTATHVVAFYGASGTLFYGTAATLVPASDNSATAKLGAAATRWNQLFLGPTGIKLGDGTNGPTITATGAQPNESIVLTGGGGTGTATLTNGGVLTASGGLVSTTLNLGGSTVTDFLTNTATLNFGSILAAGLEDLTITVTGAAVGDTVSMGLPDTVAAGAIFNAWVSATNTVTIRCNNAGSIAIDPASASYRATVIKF